MLNLVLFGPPGAGKGTQSAKLAAKYGLIHLSTGDIFRSEVAAGTELGQKAKAIIERGELVSDDIVIGMIRSKLEAHSGAKGFIFDGFPRTIAQAEALDEMLQELSLNIKVVLSLEVPNRELIRRLFDRAKKGGRTDDQKEVVRNRVEEYNMKTAPLKDYYSQQKKIKTVMGTSGIEEVFGVLCDAIDAIPLPLRHE